MVYTKTLFFFNFQDSARISVDPNKLSDFLMTCKKTLKENHEYLIMKTTTGGAGQRE